MWDRFEIELATPGFAVRLASVVRHITRLISSTFIWKLACGHIGKACVLVQPKVYCDIIFVKSESVYRCNPNVSHAPGFMVVVHCYKSGSLLLLAF